MTQQHEPDDPTQPPADPTDETPAVDDLPGADQTAEEEAEVQRDEEGAPPPPD
jgi:hypothetical protein